MEEQEITKPEEVKEKPAEKPPGIRITQPSEPEVPPPLAAKEGAEEIPPEVKVAAAGKIPISPAVVKPLLRFEGILLAETTGYKGWLYTEEDLENIADLVRQTGLEATPMLQLGFCLGGMHAERGMAYLFWKRQGKPKEMAMMPEEVK